MNASNNSEVPAKTERPALNVVPIRRRERPVSGRGEIAAKLRGIADKVERSSDVRGVIVIIDKSAKGSDKDHISTVLAGDAESLERSHWVISRVWHRIMSRLPIGSAFFPL